MVGAAVGVAGAGWATGSGRTAPVEPAVGLVAGGRCLRWPPLRTLHPLGEAVAAVAAAAAGAVYVRVVPLELPAAVGDTLQGCEQEQRVQTLPLDSAGHHQQLPMAVEHSLPTSAVPLQPPQHEAYHCRWTSSGGVPSAPAATAVGPRPGPPADAVLQA